MEAKDTIMKDLSKAILDNLDLLMGQAIAKEQAEIAFKAGMKEVVEWVEGNRLGDIILLSLWQAKLKEWRVTDASD